MESSATATGEDATTRAARWRPLGAGPRVALRLAFVLVYLLGVISEAGVLWRIDPATTTILAAAFTAFGLLGSVMFSFARALPPSAAAEASKALDAGRCAIRASVLSLAALVIAHGFAEGWGGMTLLASFPPTDVAVRVLFVALSVGGATIGVVALWRIDALLSGAGARASRVEPS
ncbi:MAG TPA: hypothetical protein VIS07_06160 [Candidatus Binatia bacterium]